MGTSKVDKAEARHEIARLIYGYSEALDGGDLDRVCEILEHCVLRVPANGLECRGGKAIRKMFEDYTIFYDANGRAAANVDGAHPHTCHFVGNLLIDVDDDGLHASSRAYVIVFQARPGFTLQPVFRNRYHDRFECVGGKWRFVERVEVLDEFQGDVSHHLYITPNTAS
jgi:ketosteroid isomerase-like protein